MRLVLPARRPMPCASNGSTRQRLAGVAERCPSVVPGALTAHGPGGPRAKPDIRGSVTELARHNGDVSFWYAETSRPGAARAADRASAAPRCASSAAASPACGPPTTSNARVPEIDIVVLEREFAGFGASGRNGGWLSSDIATPRAAMARLARARGVLALQRAMRATVDEVIAVCEREQIDADIVKHGMIRVARNPAQRRAASDRDLDRLRGTGASAADDLVELDAASLARRIRCRRWACRHVDAARRARAAGQARPGAGRRCRAPRRADLRGHGGEGDHARNRADRSRHRPRALRPQLPRGLHRRSCAASTGPGFRSTRR